MKNHYSLFIILLLTHLSLWAGEPPRDSLKAVQPMPVSTRTVVTDLAHLDETVRQMTVTNNAGTNQAGAQFRNFPELNSYTSSVNTIDLGDVAEFTPERIKNWNKTDIKTDSIISAAKSLFEEIKSHGKFIEQMTGNELVQLPVGIQKRLAGGFDSDGNMQADDQHTTLTVGVIKAKLYPTYSEVDLFAKLEIGPLNTTLFFGASGVKFSHTGGIYGDARLNLLQDVSTGQGGGQWLLTFKGGLDQSTGNADGQTYITIDCEGNVKEIALTADVRIAKTVAVPVNEDGSYKYPGDLEPGGTRSAVDNDSYVGANFRMMVNSINDLVIELNLPRFELRKLPKWGFYMKNAVLDLSDTRNAKTKIDFPAIYTQQQLLVPGNEELWRGFYADEVSIMLPPEFQRKGSDERITIGVKNLLIDNFGASGNFYATNVLPLKEGSANKWQFSVDDIGVDIQVNHFVKATFNGEIVLPVSTLKDDEKNDTIQHGALKYAGLITSDRLYSVRVDVAEDVDFSIFKSKAKLFRDSYIKLEVKDDKFQPEANLTGLMSFNKSQEDQLNSVDSSGGDVEELDFEGLSFQNFKIQTASRPYLSIGYMGYKDSVSLPKFYGFQLGFYDIKVASDTSDDSAELGFNSYINLDESGIHGDVRMRIIGELVDGDFLKWKYKKMEIDSIEVDVKRKSFEFNGKLHFFREHAIYGKGLAGSLNLYAESLKIRLQAKGIFGSVDDYRYWFVDAYGQPTANGNKNFTIYDIGGGVYHHMRKAGYDEQSGSMSGIYYLPDKTNNFGFKALAAFEVKKSATFTGLVAIEMSFNSESAGGGVGRVGFYGAASLMTGKSANTDDTGRPVPFGTVESMQQKVSEKEQSLSNFHDLSIDKEGIKYFAQHVFPDVLTSKELFAAQVGIDLDFTNETYWGMFDVFLNAGAIKGEGDKNRLGYLEFYNAPNDWYIYVGTPEQRFGVRDIPIGPFKAAVNLYFMAGTILPDPAKPDYMVLSILDLNEQDLAFGRNFEDQLAVGNGYAFGATFRLGMGFDWGFVYAKGEAGAGFDLMMRNFGDASCKGRDGPVGMDGWYATGQLYAYVYGELGVRIKILGLRKNIKILEAGIATLAQGQFPNPWYLKGYAGFKVRVLGLITVKGRLKVIIGEECEMIGKTGLQEINMISDVLPADKSKNADVFDAIQVAFNAPMGQLLQVDEDSGRKTYRLSLKAFSAKEDGNEIIGEQSWNNENDLLIFEPDDILPPEKEITVTVKVAFEERVNGVWKLVTDDQGNALVEEKTTTFTTGEAPAHIPYKNIVFMYPIIDQQYMLPKESNSGYIQLKQGQDYLFGLSGYKDELFFIDENGQEQKAQQFTYNNTTNTLNFSLPVFNTGASYTFRLVTSKIGSGQVAATVEGNVQVADGISMTQNLISGSASTDALFERLKYTFTTSEFNTFKEKINSLNVTNYNTFIDGASNVGFMGLGLSEYEPFGVNDVLGTTYTDNKPLIRLEGIQEDFYYTERVYPLVYKNYPLDGNIRVDRDEADLGMPPIRSFRLSNGYRFNVLNNPSAPYLRTQFPFEWHLAYAYNQDFRQLQYTITNRYLNTGTLEPWVFDKFGYIINGVFPYLEKEYYKVKAEYVLPDKTSGNSAVINYKNEF